MEYLVRQPMWLALFFVLGFEEGPIYRWQVMRPDDFMLYRTFWFFLIEWR